MNQNYVRKCEEYLQNIPSQKLARPPSSLAGSNLSSRKLTQKPGPPPVSSLRQGRQSINNPPPLPPPVPPPPAEGSRPKPKPPTTTMTGRRTPFRSPTVGSGSTGQQQQQQGSKFIRPCCRPKGGGIGRRGSDNVNQNVDVRVMDRTDGGGGGGGCGEGTTERKTKTWDGILAEVAMETVEASLTQIKSKAHSPPPPEPAPITSTFPKGAVQHPLMPNPSVTSLSTTVTSSSVAVRPASSSIAAVSPQPRALPSTTTAEHVHRKPSSTSTMTEAPPENQFQLQGINLFRFDPLRTLQFLTLELKSKLKPLLTTTTAVVEDGTSVHKQLYKISKELLYAVKILTENASQQKPATTCNCCCQPCDKVTSIGKVSSKPTICGDPEASLECQNCLELQNALDRLRAEQSCLPRKEINYLQDPRPPEDSSKASTATDQLQHRLEGEIKRLQTMISDKQTTPTAAAATEGLISDLNRKLDEATHARDEAQRKLLYATLENERLNFLLRSQCSTMTNLRNDFSAIQSLAVQQIDLLDQTNNNVNDGILNDDHRSRSKSNTVALAFGGNHHRNYRYPSGSGGGGGGATLATASPVEQVVKLRHHYSFQNIAEKESDDGGNDANDCLHWRNSSQRQPQEPEVMLRLPSSTLLVGRRDAFQQQWEKPELKKNRATEEEAESGTSEPSGSLSEANSVRSGRFGPTKRALLIDSDRDNSLEKNLEGSQKQQQQSSSSSSLSSLTSSQQQQQQQQLQQRHRGHKERKEPRTTIGDNRRKPPVPTLGDEPFTSSTTEDDTENLFGYTNNNANNNHHIQNSKTNDCVSLAPGIDGMATNRQQLGPGGGSKKDTLPVLTTTVMAAKGKYPRDYGDKFERRESLLAVAGTGPGQELEEKELCQNRPIMGQIRSGSEGEGKKKGEVLVGKIISDDANEPASGQTRTTTTTTATEEFSIDFDDITLPSSPIPFRGRREGAGEEFPSSFGDWM